MFTKIKEIISNSSRRITSGIEKKSLDLLVSEEFNLLNLKLDKVQELSEIRIKQQDGKLELTSININEYNEIVSETNDEGKPLFSNDIKRKAELAQRLNTDDNCIKLEAAQKQYSSRIEIMNVENEMISHLIRTCENVIKSI